MGSRAGLDRAAVVAAAARLVDERGWEALSLTGLARQLRVEPPSLYNHIAGLAGLRRELALMALDELDSTLGKAAIGKSGDEAVIALAQAYRSFIKRRPGLYAATVAPAASDQELATATDRILETCLSAMSAYRFNRRQAVHALRSVRATVHGFATLETSGGFGIPVAIDESFGFVMKMLLRGLARNSVPAGRHARRAEDRIKRRSGSLKS